ncbi:hypothetical protein BDZ89DRAFT_632687 [Hymenopellis radicata]|nr:hypothetical protein BDZ89DRAFT_632687 [Hymenopellis radicata]
MCQRLDDGRWTSSFPTAINLVTPNCCSQWDILATSSLFGKSEGVKNINELEVSTILAIVAQHDSICSVYRLLLLLDRKLVAMTLESPEIVELKVKGLLNKLTMEEFDSISDQIIAWANKSENEKDVAPSTRSCVLCSRKLPRMLLRLKCMRACVGR